MARILKHVIGLQGSLTALSDLDDNCLSHIFDFLDPLPDLFNVACTSRRFCDIVTYGNMCLLVSGRTPHPSGRLRSASGRSCRSMFPTVEEAVAASRPGDTILLEAGEVHRVAGCIIPWPLHLVGAGKGPEDTLLIAARGSPGLLFKASGKLANLAVQSRRAPCVWHQRGRLTVEGCLLDCNAEGLDHLFAPLVTVACSLQPRLPAGGPIVAVTAPECFPRGGRLWNGFEPANSQAGVLLVVGTKIKGSRGSRAVHAEGSGSLRSVRVINLSRECLYWFEVDSAVYEPSPSKAAGFHTHHNPAWHTEAGALPGHAPATPAAMVRAPLPNRPSSHPGDSPPSGHPCHAVTARRQYLSHTAASETASPAVTATHCMHGTSADHAQPGHTARVGEERSSGGSCPGDDGGPGEHGVGCGRESEAQEGIVPVVEDPVENAGLLLRSKQWRAGNYLEAGEEGLHAIHESGHRKRARRGAA